jgi:hypothetical protein
MYPLTIQGKVFGGLAALVGILVIGMPVGVISTKFFEYFKEMEINSFLEKHYKEDAIKKI